MASVNTHVQQSERPGYLAQVLSVGGNDGQLGTKELRALRGVIQRIGATHEDLVEAVRLRGEGRALPPLRSPLARMQNVQDMVMVALADGDLAGAEAKPIEALAAALRYSQADMDIIVKRAEDELGRVMAAFPETGGLEAVVAESPSSSTAPPPVPVRKSAQPVGASPAKVAEPESAVSGVVEPDTFLMDESEPDGVLPEGACIEDVEASGEDADVSRCAACRDASGDGDSYCFGAQSGEPNIWGCRLLEMPWAPGADWLTLGSFENGDTFVFDREAIGVKLTDAMERVEGCPYFDDALAMMALIELPRSASPMGRWTLREVAAAEAGEQVVRMEYLHGCAVQRASRASGVDPVGANQAAKLIRRILSRLPS